MERAALRLTLLCKSSRGLGSETPVLAMVTAGDRVPVPGRCSYLSTGVDGGLEQRERPCCPERAAHIDRWDRWTPLIGTHTHAPALPVHALKIHACVFMFCTMCQWLPSRIVFIIWHCTWRHCYDFRFYSIYSNFHSRYLNFYSRYSNFRSKYSNLYSIFPSFIPYIQVSFQLSVNIEY